MGAMTSLHVGMNAIPEKQMKEISVIAMSKDSMKLLCEVPIKDKTLTELDGSGKRLGTEGALVVAEYLRDDGALSKLIFGGDGYVNNEKGEHVKAEPATLEVGMTEANLCNKNLGEGGAIIISAWITHKDNGAISVKVHGLLNAQHLNGLTGRVKEDLPNGRRVVQLENGEQKSLKPANLEIITGNGALSKLIFGGDYDFITGTTPEPATLEVGMTEANFSNKLGAGGAFIISAWITHKDKGAMTSLNLAGNWLEAEGAKHIAGAIKVSKYVLAVILVRFSCESDYWFNCCCLLLSAGYGGHIAFGYQ
jgi:hypothetical protein